jgi:glutamate N-acetyltransferase/amino-acid N-acetyltransferase
VLGQANARLTAEAGERALDAHDNTLFVMSTGVIGVQLPMETLLAAIPRAAEQLRADGWEDAARAIMTTDTHPKLATRTVEVGGAPVRITGMAKGAGMIHPNMATMLAVVATDALVAQPLLQQALKAAADRSFNRISVDGDTSTNDTLLLLANGLAGNPEIDGPGADYDAFAAALTELCTELAQGLVRDGEGATKFVAIAVNGAESDAAAHQIANTVATSPLVKTAFYGNDANWGRILAAVGRAGVPIDPDRCDLFIAGQDSETALPELQLVAGGAPTGYQEADATAIFTMPEIDVRVELGLGNGKAVVWTSDLSHEYVSINADYRT